MFKKRNFSLISSPSRDPAVLIPGSPAKRTRLLSSTLRTPSFLQDATRANSTERSSPFFQKLSDTLNVGNKHQLTALIGEKESTLNETLDISKTLLTLEDADRNEVTSGPVDHQVVQERPKNGHFGLDTPPPTPAFQIESKIDLLRRKKKALEEENERLDNQFEAKYQEIKIVREKTIEIQSKDSLYDDHLDILIRTHKEVRGILNDIFYPGNDLGKRAASCIEEVRRRHNKKYEKVIFEMNHRLETTEEAVKKKFIELEHEIELHERTLMTIECQKRHQQSQEVEKGKLTEAKVESKQETSAIDNKTLAGEGSHQNDDDCIIIDDNDTVGSEVANEVEFVSHTPPDTDELTRNVNVSGASAANNSGSTATYDTEEETDIEEEEPRSFTPCQAQRPN